MRTITSVDELDQILAECERAAQVSDDELRRVFQTFRMDVSAQLPPDPFSAEYANAQMALYERSQDVATARRTRESIFDAEAPWYARFPTSRAARLRACIGARSPFCCATCSYGLAPECSTSELDGATQRWPWRNSDSRLPRLISSRVFAS